MKKNWIVFPIILLIVIGTAFFSCGEEDSGPKVETYTSKDEANIEYILKITDGAKYELKIDGESVSTGTVSKEGDTFTLIPNGDPEAKFTVTISGNKITKIEGNITPDDGSKPITPGEMVEPKPVAGVWTWALSDDSNPNGSYMNPQTIFAPGGASRFFNAVEDPDETDRFDKPVQRPSEYTTEVLDNDGNPIEGKVYSLKGVTKVSAENRPYNSGAQFPLVGWEAVPDDDTLDLLKTAYGYSFWIRLNSATANKWAFLTAVVTDFAEEKGYEYKHYFGNQPGDSRSKNLTKNLELGKWQKITVVMKMGSGFNMDQDGWIYQYPPSPRPPNVFNQNNAEKIQWQIPLQHNGGKSRPWTTTEIWSDMISGEYDFDLDFYGLELLVE